MRTLIALVCTEIELKSIKPIIPLDLSVYGE